MSDIFLRQSGVLAISRDSQKPLLCFAALVILAGCSTYNEQTKTTIESAIVGDIDKSLVDLESHNRSKDKELLYYLEKGEILRLKGAHSESRDSWLVADQKVHEWEQTARYTPDKLLGDLGSVIMNDTTLPYYGRDYEKVFLSVRLALNHLAMNEWDKARVEIKKMHERESIIAEFRSKELDAAKAKAREKSLSATAPKDLNGYPIETLTDPEVRSLKNSYESAFANYLAGFVYESQGDISLAAPGYRKAAEMRPNIPLIDRGLSELDTRAGKKQNPNLVDTLIVIETGEAPQVISKSVPIPIPTPKGLEITAMSWPVVQPDNLNKRPTAVKIDGQPVEFATLTDVNPMARRAISDEMPGIIARSSIRAITRAASQYAIDQANSQNTGNAALVGALFSLATKIATVATEVADTRIWRTLPGHYSISRTQLPAGIHQIKVATATGTTQKDFLVSSGKYSFVELRSYGANVYVTPSPILPSSVPVARLDNTIVAIQKIEKYQR